MRHTAPPPKNQPHRPLLATALECTLYRETTCITVMKYRLSRATDGQTAIEAQDRIRQNNPTHRSRARPKLHSRHTIYCVIGPSYFGLSVHDRGPLLACCPLGSVKRVNRIAPVEYAVMNSQRQRLFDEFNVSHRHATR